MLWHSQLANWFNHPPPPPPQIMLVCRTVKKFLKVKLKIIILISQDTNHFKIQLLMTVGFAPCTCCTVFIFLTVRLVGWLVWGGGGGGWYTIKQPRGKWSGWMVQKMGNQSSELYRENIYIMLHQKWWLGGSSNIQLRDGDSLGGMNCCMVRTNHGSIVYRPLRRPARPKKGLVELYCTPIG